MFVYSNNMGYNYFKKLKMWLMPTSYKIHLSVFKFRLNWRNSMKKNNKLLYLTAMAGAAAVSIYGINKAINVINNAKSTLANPNGLRYEWRFGDIFYTVQGSGKPVLLIHDLSCGSSDIEWKYIVKEYAKTNQVYTIDLLGCGRSDKPSITYTNYLYVQLITDFVKHVIGHRTDVIATGLSTSFVLMACYNDNTIFDKLLFINPNNLLHNNQEITIYEKSLKKLIELPDIGTLIYNIVNRKTKYVKRFKTEYYHNTYAVRGSLIQAYYDSSHYGEMSSKYLLASLNSNYLCANVTRALKDINNSIFILGSEFEPNIKETIADYTEINPSIETSILKDLKHLPQLEKPTEVFQAIKIYL